MAGNRSQLGAFRITTITGEAGTVAGASAGDTGSVVLVNAPILNADGSDLGKKGDTSLAITCNALTKEVAYKDEILANGDYFIDYQKGIIYYKKATTTTAATFNYKIMALVTT